MAVRELRVGPVPTLPDGLESLGEERTHLVFVLKGELEAAPAGPGRPLGALDWCLRGAGPLKLRSAAGADVLILSLPGCPPTGVPGAVRSAAAGMGKVLLACIHSALQTAAELAPQARLELGRSLHDLATQAMREGVAGERRSRREVMRERVKAFVRNNLHDSSLSIDDIAQAFNCTKRYLHKVFSGDERSLNQYIWDLRLERCGQDLANPELAGRSITEIAFAWGFRSTPHFSRAFRQRFSTSPSLYRALVNGEARAVAPAAAPVKAAVGNGADAVVGPVAPLAAASRAPSPRLGAAQALSDFPI